MKRTQFSSLEYMNNKVLKDKIKFTLENSETELVFLDIKVHLKNEFLIPEIYSNQQTRMNTLTQDLHTHRTWRKTFHIQWH